MTKQNIVKNQHYIPECLLWPFTDSKGKFSEVLCRSSKIYQTNPTDSMSAKFVYEDENLEINTIEKFFNRIETQIAPSSKKLIQIIDDYKKSNSNFAEIKNLIENLLPIYLVFYYRSGALLTEFSSISKKDKIPLLSKKILNRGYIQALAKTIIDCYEFGIIESKNDFLMSDQFVSTAALKIKSQFSNISNRHIGIKETLILIPISSNYYAVYWHTASRFFLKSNGMNLLNDDETKLINNAIINNSYNKAICQKKINLEEALLNFSGKSPSQVYIGHTSGANSGYIRKKEVFLDDLDKEAYGILTNGLRIKEYSAAGRNDQCPCLSGKKFKKCHEDIYGRIKLPIETFFNQSQDFKIPNSVVVEMPIDAWGPYKNTN